MIGCVFLHSSCNLINPAEPVPAYVHVDSVSLSTNPLTQGSSSNKIVDAWVYVDGTIVGTFEMPVTLPVLSAGIHSLTIKPGILIDGIAATRTNYPFYRDCDTTVNFEPGKILNVVPRTTYTSSAVFSQLEDFDQAGTSLVPIFGSDTIIRQVLDANAFEGQSGKVDLDASHTFFACASKDSFPLPSGHPVYLELNYLSDNEFTIGLIAYTSSQIFSEDIVTFKSSTTWKKEYVNLTPFVSTTTLALGYKIYIKATKSTDLTTATLYFDNIKVVH